MVLNIVPGPEKPPKGALHSHSLCGAGGSLAWALKILVYRVGFCLARRERERERESKRASEREQERVPESCLSGPPSPVLGVPDGEHRGWMRWGKTCHQGQAWRTMSE